MRSTAKDAGPHPLRALEASGVAYVRFAERHLGHFRVMFQNSLINLRDPKHPLDEAGAPTDSNGGRRGRPAMLAAPEPGLQAERGSAKTGRRVSRGPAKDHPCSQTCVFNFFCEHLFFKHLNLLNYFLF
jgi:hypothetical protein